MKKSVLFIFLLSCFGVSLADSVKDAAREMSGLAGGAADTINNTGPEQFAPRYEGVPAGSDGYYGGGLVIPKSQGSAKIAGCENIAEEDLYKRQECEGINFVGKNPTVRPDVTISTQEPLAQGTNKITSDPTDTLNKYGWTIPFNPDGSIGNIPTESCNTELITIPAKTVEKDCSVYQGIEQYLCETTLKVEVDPSFNYSCLETKYQSKIYPCNKKLKVTCEQAMSCADTGVVPGGTQGDMRIYYSHVGDGVYNMFFGTQGDDYWGNGVHQRNMRLTIRNLDRLKMFTLLRTQFDDHLLIKINGRAVYWNNVVYPYTEGDPRNWSLISPIRSGNRYYCGSTLINYGSGYSCMMNGTQLMHVIQNERSTSWDFWPSYDLRPFLKEGENIIETHTIVGGRGESFVNFRVQQACEPVCVDSWENNCTEYEERVKP